MTNLHRHFKLALVKSKVSNIVVHFPQYHLGMSIPPLLITPNKDFQHARDKEIKLTFTFHLHMCFGINQTQVRVDNELA